MDWRSNGKLCGRDGEAYCRFGAKESEAAAILGELAGFLKQTNQLVGAMLMKPLPDGEGDFTEEIEVGWHLAQAHWGNGYATEGGQKMLELGFTIQNLQQIYAVTGLENQKSQSVACRLGMKLQGRTDKYYGQTVDLFKITLDEWSAMRGE